MENTSLLSDIFNNDTTTSLKYDDQALYLVLKVVSITVGIVGVLDNLFVIVIFASFINITDKVSASIIIIDADTDRHAKISMSKRLIPCQ